MNNIHKPIRVLHIVGIMNMGGIENFLMNVYRKLDKNQIQFDFLVTREEEGIFDEEIRDMGGIIYNIPHMATVGIHRYRRNLLRFFKSHSEFRVVHCHRDALCGVYLREAKKAKIPVRIAHSHTIQLAEGKGITAILKTFIKKYFMTYIKDSTTHYFACSEEAGKWLFGKKIARNQLQVVKNGIDVPKYIFKDESRQSIRKELNIGEETILVGHVGRMEEPKNHEFLIDIFKNLCSTTNLDIKLCLVGEGKLEKLLKDKAKILGIEDKIIWLGLRKDVNRLMMGFDIFLFPSLFEGLGIVLIEAQATGLGCLVSDKIPKEVDMGMNLVVRIEIEDSSKWVQEISNYIKDRSEKRTSNLDKIRCKGYDINQNILEIEKIYLK